MSIYDVSNDNFEHVVAISTLLYVKFEIVSANDCYNNVHHDDCHYDEADSINVLDRF